VPVGVAVELPAATTVAVMRKVSFSVLLVGLALTVTVTGFAGVLN
jgi:hypothetical protein